MNSDYDRAMKEYDENIKFSKSLHQIYRLAEAAFIKFSLTPNCPPPVREESIEDLRKLKTRLDSLLQEIDNEANA